MKNNSLIVTYEEHCEGGENEDSGEWSSRTPEDCSFYVTGAYLPDKNGLPLYSENVEVNFIPKKNQFVYIVVVRYSTGDTFGHTSGKGLIEGAYQTPEEADAIKEAINKGYLTDARSKDYSDYNALKKCTRDRGVYSFTWEGYFESLEDVEIVCQKIQ